MDGLITRHQGRVMVTLSCQGHCREWVQRTVWSSVSDISQQDIYHDNQAFAGLKRGRSVILERLTRFSSISWIYKFVLNFAAREIAFLVCYFVLVFEPTVLILAERRIDKYTESTQPWIVFVKDENQLDRCRREQWSQPLPGVGSVQLNDQVFSRLSQE